MNERLSGILADVFGLRKDEVHADLKKDDVSRWDSLKQLDLVTSLENEFEIALEIEDIARMSSVAEIVKVLTEKKVDLED